jgi:phage portal protein BeeE
VSWLDRVQARATGTARTPSRVPTSKTFSMPPFWSDGARVVLGAVGTGSNMEQQGVGFEEYTSSLYRENGIIFACTVARARVFAQARFQYQKMQGGRPGDLYGDPRLLLLERPWPGAGTSDMLTSMEVDASISGNAFWTVVDSDGKIGRQADRRDPDLRLSRMRPDWVTLIMDSPTDQLLNVDAKVIALRYMPPGMRDDPLTLVPGEYSHYAPLPDPLARWRGMSWLTPVIRDAQADKAYTNHTLAFLKNGANPNMVVTLDADTDPDEFAAFVEQFREEYEGSGNAYKTLFLGGGADVTPLAASFDQIDFKGSQGKLETRIAAAAGVHPSIAGLSEGLAGSALNAGNFGAARRLMVDSTIRHLWANAASALEALCPPPSRSTQRLWYDSRDIPFLREDAGDEAKTFMTQAQAAVALANGGWDPDAAIKAAKAADISLLLGQHTGMLSVQLQQPGAQQPEPTAPASQPTEPPTLELERNGHGRPLALIGR